eukprot:1145448-Pelagomonas_calceolata.AAC.3
MLDIPAGQASLVEWGHPARQCARGNEVHPRRPLRYAQAPESPGMNGWSCNRGKARGVSATSQDGIAGAY